MSRPDTISVLLLVGKRFFSVRRYALVTLVGIGLVYAAWFALPHGIQKYAESRYEQRFPGGKVTLPDRTVLWQQSFEYLMDNPLGVGWSLWIEPIGTYPHNDYLSYAIAFGFMCGLLYLFIPAWLLFSLSTFKPRNSDPARLAIVLAGVGVTTAFLVNSFSDHLTANRWYFNVVWSIIWYAFFVSRAGTGASLAKGIFPEKAL